MKFLILIIFSVAFANEEEDLSARLAKSFNTTPIGKSEQKYIAKPTEANAQEMEAHRNINNAMCGSYNCMVRPEQSGNSTFR